MVSIGICMIVKDEEDVLARCLDSVADLVDEIVIVDTGSTDSTKEIASRYTDKIYDFTWVSDFAAARNFSFSKSTTDYIYTPDADEVLDADNRQRFAELKAYLDPEIDIVQMKYRTTGAAADLFNVKLEYRPKLFKRLREFKWIYPIHETVRLEPLVFNSDVVIDHMPPNLNSSRDFSIFKKIIEGGELDDRLAYMYASELYKVGADSDLIEAIPYFEMEYLVATEQRRSYAAAVLLRSYRLSGRSDEFYKVAMKEMAAQTQSSEVCFELGRFYQDLSDYVESFIWYYNAVYETEPILDIRVSGNYGYEAIMEVCSEIIASGADGTGYYDEIRDRARTDLEDWSMPEDGEF